MGAGIAGDIVAAIAARIALRPAESAAAALDLAASASLSRSIISAPSGCRSCQKRPQQAITRARTFGGLPPTFAAAASQRLCNFFKFVLQLLNTLQTLGLRLPAPPTRLRGGACRLPRRAGRAAASNSSGLVQVLGVGFKQGAFLLSARGFGTHRLNDLYLAEVEPLCLSVSSKAAEQCHLVSRRFLRCPPGDPRNERRRRHGDLISTVQGR